MARPSLLPSIVAGGTALALLVAAIVLNGGPAPRVAGTSPADVSGAATLSPPDGTAIPRSPDAAARPLAPPEQATTDDAAHGSGEDSSALGTPGRPGEPVVLTGRVVDLDGVPLAGVTVMYVPDATTRRAWDPALEDPEVLRADDVFRLPWTTTDAEGGFELATAVVVVARTVAPASTPGLALVHAHHAPRCFACEGLRGGRFETGDIPMGPGTLLTGTVVDESGRLVAGASVQLASSKHVRDATGAPRDADPERITCLVRTLSEASGRFALRVPVVGRVALQVEAQGFLAEHAPWVEVAPGEEIDVGVLVLRVGARLAGLVRDDAGHPVAGARVWAIPRRAAPGGSTDDRVARELADLGEPDEDAPAPATTDGDGRFALTGLDATHVDVVVAAEGLDAERFAALALDGRELLVDLGLAASLALDLRDGAGAPVRGAAVRARRLPRVDDDSGPDAGLDLAVTESADVPGRYHAVGLGPVANDVLVRAAGCAATHLALPGVVAPAELARTLVLSPGLTLAGRVVDETGAPVSAAELTLLPPGDLAALDRQRTVPGDDGLWRFEGLCPGEWRLGVSAPGYAQVPPRTVRLAADTAHEPLEIVLGAAGTIRGRVLAPDGSPRAGHQVFAERLQDAIPPHRLADGAIVHAAQRAPAWARSGPAGDFELPGLTPGTWHLVAHPGAEHDVQLAPGSEVVVELALRQPPVVHGRVLDGDQPVRGARVFVRHRTQHTQSALGWCSSLADGSFRLESSLPGDLWAMAKHPEGASTAPRDVSVTWGGEQAVDLHFAAGRIAGVAEASDGSGPVADLELEILESASRNRWRSATDAEGHFAFEHLLPGSYSVRVVDDRYLRDDPLRIDLATDAVRDDLRLTARRGAVFHGRITTTRGLPAPDGTCVTLAPATSGPWDAPWDEDTKDGAFRFAGLPPGDFVVRVFGSHHDPWFGQVPPLIETPVRLELAQELRLDLTIIER